MFVLKPEQLVGKQVGGYRLTKFLKGGGFGFVYEAEDLNLERKVAIKLLKPEHVSNAEHVAAFKREAKIIASFDHPHILKVHRYDVYHDDEDLEIPFIVMPFIEQGSLRILHSHASVLNIATIIFYVKQIASALQYAHDHKTVHRDVKPDNFLCGPQGVLLSDFGIAIAAHSVNSLSPQVEIGTSSYMAPEQWEGQARIWSDQYSLAVVVYEWLCGKLPFDGKSPFELYQKHKKETPPSFKQQGLDVPQAIEQAVRKGLAKVPDERFASITAFAKTLEQGFLGQTVTILPLPQIVSQVQEEPILQAPPNDQRRNSFEQLWAELMQAQVRGDNKQAFCLLLEILKMEKLTSSQKDLVESEIRSLPQMIPWGIQRARKASIKGRWPAEIQLWNDVLALVSLQQKFTEQLTLAPITLSRWESVRIAQQNDLFESPFSRLASFGSGKVTVEGAIRERLRIAQQNNQHVWMYSQAQQFITKQDNAAARKQLKTLWRQAPFYGDPADLAYIVGLSPADNYEQALAKELKLKQQQKEAAARERQKEAAAREQVKKRRARAAAVSAGTSVGCLAGILLTLLLGAWKIPVRGGTSIGHLISVFVNFPGWWISVITVGVLVGLVIGAKLNSSYDEIGPVSGGIVGYLGGVVIWGIICVLIAEANAGIIINIICMIISLCIGPFICAVAGAVIGGVIEEKWDHS